ncbi:peptidase inhibitor family I36 protein [Nonomuraea sp. NPDC050394]|uniref:peptidase inhibitor family I36 protein n=1 Tax=Nonomuraea sp. NPDC050394 TaxID=3364363 RepID=UPI0037AD369E
MVLLRMDAARSGPCASQAAHIRVIADMEFPAPAHAGKKERRSVPSPALAARKASADFSKRQKGNDMNISRKLSKLAVVAAVMLALGLFTAPTAATAAEAAGRGTAEQAAVSACRSDGPNMYYCVTAIPNNVFIPCPARNICLYTNADWTGMQVRWPAGQYHPNFAIIRCPSGYCDGGDLNGDFNDEVSSWANNHTGYEYCVRTDAGTGGRVTAMPSGTQDNWIAAGWNDVISSLSSSGC